MMEKIRKAWQKFFFAPASARPIAALRVAVAVTLLVQLYLLRSTALDFLAQDGLVQGPLAQFFRAPYTPRIGWLASGLAGFGFDESQCIYLTCSLYVLSLVFLAVGLFTRPASVLTWFLHWTLINTGYSTSYGVDLYAHVFLFYLMWMPAGAVYSADYPLGRTDASPSAEARLSLRVLQLHLCITYLTSGIEKARGIQWWNGELLWRALTLPVYRQYDFSWIANWPLFLKVGGWATLALEIGYAVFIWPRATRCFWIAAIVAMHLGIAVFLGLGVFGSIMALLTLCVFAVPADPVLTSFSAGISRESFFRYDFFSRQRMSV